jgi:Type I restriction enzyme R protein N terminus (HSDR_N)
VECRELALMSDAERAKLEAELTARQASQQSEQRIASFVARAQELPVEGGRADYALFIGLTVAGVVEAKRETFDVAGAIDQSKRYSRGLRDAEFPSSPRHPLKELLDVRARDQHARATALGQLARAKAPLRDEPAYFARRAVQHLRCVFHRESLRRQRGIALP